PAPAAHRPDGAPYDARDLRLSRIPRRRGVDELRREQCRRRSPGWHLCWPHPQGRQAGRPAGPAGGESRADHQSDHHPGPRHYAAADAARPRRRGDRVNRRAFITLPGGAAAACPLAARAQQITQIGVLWHAGNEEEEAIYLSALRRGFNDQGYVESRNFTLVNTFAGEVYERFTSNAAELVRRRVDVIVAVTRLAAVAAQRATSTIPIVFVVVPDPIKSGLVQSL